MDPTFRFKNSNKDIEIYELLASGKISSKRLGKFLKGKNAPIRALAVSYLDKSDEKRMVEIYRNDPSSAVRMQALKNLADNRSDTFTKILIEAANDNSEFIRRIATVWMGDVGKSEYIPILADLRVNDPSKRVQFNAKSALDQIDPEMASEACKKKILELPQSSWRTALLKRTEASFARTKEWIWDELIKNIEDTTLEVTKRIRSVRTFRNYRFQQAIKNLLNVALDHEEITDLRMALLEALGWFTFSSQRDAIIAACDQILKNENESADIRRVALMTKTRLLEGPTNSITP